MGGRLLFLSCCRSEGYKAMVQTREDDNWLSNTSFGPEWRLKLPSIPLVPVSSQKRWECLPLENHKETSKSKSKETTSAKSRGKL